MDAGERTAHERARRLLQACVECGIEYCSGVPDSLLASLFALLERGGPLRYYPAAREDVALGFASGCYLGGRIAAVALQNSGLGNMINPLTSLNLVYGIPALLIIGWRGQEPTEDAPEHRVIGPITPQVLSTMGIEYQVLSPASSIEDAVTTSVAQMARRKCPAALLVQRGVLE